MITEYHVQFDDKPQSYWDALEADGFWEQDLSLVEDEAEIHRALGATNVRIVSREVYAEPCPFCGWTGRFDGHVCEETREP